MEFIYVFIYLTECVVTDFGEWGPCRYPRTDNSFKSYKTDIEFPEEGEATRMWSMAEKERQRKEWTSCIKEGTCPSRESQARTDCVDGTTIISVSLCVSVS